MKEILLFSAVPDWLRRHAELCDPGTQQIPALHDGKSLQVSRNTVGFNGRTSCVVEFSKVETDGGATAAAAAASNTGIFW
jgi:hypothetical protein